MEDNNVVPNMPMPPVMPDGQIPVAPDGQGLVMPDGQPVPMETMPEAAAPVPGSEQPVPEPEQIAPEQGQSTPELEQPVPEQGQSTPEPEQPALAPEAAKPEPQKKKGSPFDKLKGIDWKKADVKAVFSALTKGEETVSDTATTFEINLVPSVKAEAIKAIKRRNLVLFICLIVIAVAGGAVAILGSVVAGQEIARNGQTNKISTMSDKIKEFNGVSEYLTIQDQLKNISAIEDKEKVLSRVFPFMSVLLPDGPDTITISELNVDLKENKISFTGQADAGTAPYIDYRVLESFKKSSALVTYDYGRYVDKEGEEIPTRCIIEANNEGGTLVDGSSVYAYWLRGKSGCDKAITERDLELAEMLEEREAQAADEEDNVNESDEDRKKREEEESEELIKAKKEIYDKYKDRAPKNWYDKWLKAHELDRYSDDDITVEDAMSMEAAYNEWYDGLSDEEKWIVELELSQGVSLKDVNVRKIWRTPQFSNWYKNGYIDLSGTISGVPHFDSQCVKYSGTEMEDTIRWTAEENQCTLLTEPIEISDSSNGRDSDNNLVLRFEASATLDEQALLFRNKNVMAIGPNGRDVTDSYVQVAEMFKEEAKACSSSDVVCTSSEENVTGGGNDGE